LTCCENKFYLIFIRIYYFSVLGYHTYPAPTPTVQMKDINIFVKPEYSRTMVLALESVYLSGKLEGLEEGLEEGLKQLKKK
jgi:hypothetical protein